MKLEPIIQSEVSQKDKDQYSILTHIYGILKDGSSVLLIAPLKQSASVLMASDSITHVNIHLVNLIHIPS